MQVTEIPGLSDVVPGTTEALVRDILGPKLLPIVEQDHPEFIEKYADIVRAILSCAYGMGCIEGTDGWGMGFAPSSFDLEDFELELLLGGLTGLGYLVKDEEGRYKMSKGAAAAIRPPPSEELS